MNETMETIRCVACGHSEESGNNFCTECGASLTRQTVSALYPTEFFAKIENLTRPSSGALVQAIFERYSPSSVVDIGCGSGVYLKAFSELGSDCFGIDGATDGIARLEPISGLEHDLHIPLDLDRQFDLCLCWETAEHLRPEAALTLIETLTSHSDHILFSAATPGQGGDYHYNEQPLSYWQLLFLECGFELNPRETGWLRNAATEAECPHWLVHNLACFERSCVPAIDLQRERDVVRHLSGWLSEGEAALLATCTRHVTSPDPVIVEIGSWHGKSTVALAKALRSFTERGTVFAIDHHIGDPDLAEHLEASWHDLSSWRVFSNTLQFANAKECVVPLVTDALVAATEWDRGPIDFLWIDGDHRYEIVHETYRAWERHLKSDALVAFHDTTNLEGPMRVTRELAESGCLRPLVQIDSIFLGSLRQTEEASSFPVPAIRKTTSLPKISIAIATRNEGDYVEKTIESLFAHTFYPNFELLLFDDASSDDSCGFLQKSPYLERPEIQFHPQESQQGYLELRNKAADLATGDHLMFLDAHSAFTDYWLWNLFTELETRDYRAIVGPAVTNLDVDSWSPAPHACYGWHIDRDLQKIWPGGWHEIGPAGRVPCLTGHQTLVPKAVYEETGGLLPFFQGHGGEDIEFSLRAARYGYDCVVVPTSLIAHLFKQSFMNPVTWQDIFVNQLITSYVVFDEPGYHDCLAKIDPSPTRTEAEEIFENLRPELDRYRPSLSSRAKVSPEELRNRLPKIDS